MTQEDLMFYGLLAFAALCVVAIVYLLLAPFLTGERRAEKRMQGVAETTRTSQIGGRAALPATLARAASARSPRPSRNWKRSRRPSPRSPCAR